MNKSVIISVTGTQTNEFGEVDIQELVTTGVYYEKKGAYFIIYNESEITGMPGTTTSVKAEPQRVTLNRMGESQHKQVFETGMRNRGNYITPYGMMYMDVIPSKVDVILTDSGGSINLEYELEVENQKISDNKLSLTVRRHKMQSVLENVKNNIIKAIEQAAQKARDEGKLGFDTLPAFVLEVPREKEHGDFATNIAMLLTRQARMAPRQIAETIAEGINTESARIARIEIAGPGFINFFLENTWVYDVLPQVEKEGELYGNSATGQGKKVQVEFVSANPTGLLHMGNARGPPLGIRWQPLCRQRDLRYPESSILMMPETR